MLYKITQDLDRRLLSNQERSDSNKHYIGEKPSLTKLDSSYFFEDDRLKLLDAQGTL